MVSRIAEEPSRILIPLLVAACLLAGTGLGIAGLATNRTSGDAAQVNQAGLVRGGLQRAVKLELAGQDALALVDEASRVLWDLRYGQGAFLDEEFRFLSVSIARLRAAMVDMRAGNDRSLSVLLTASEDAWLRSNALVDATQRGISQRRRLFMWGLSFMAAGVALAALSVVISKLYVADKVEVEATYDTMTGGLRKNRFMERLNNLVDTLGRGESVGVVMFDLDRFKRINDSFGHDAGDRVLAAVGGTIRSLLRPGDVFGRMGGEEFAVAIRSKDPRAARLFSERVRAAVESIRLERLPIITISAGAVVLKKGEKPMEALKRADSHLYAAKAAGRNRVRGD